MAMKKRSKMVHNTRGFTIVELMVTLLIVGVITAAMYAAFTTQLKSYTAQDQVTEMQQNIRAAMSLMTKEIRMAGFDPNAIGDADITTATATSLIFTMVADDDGIDNDNADGDNDTSTGADETDELKTVAYDLYDAYGDGGTDIGRQVDGVKSAAAENIDRLEFYYTLKNDTKTLTPGNPSDIRSIQLSILARADVSDPNFTHTESFTTVAGTNWSAFNDHFRRRFMTATIQCRNMGL